jgi:hypothetical protein
VLGRGERTVASSSGAVVGGRVFLSVKRGGEEGFQRDRHRQTGSSWLNKTQSRPEGLVVGKMVTRRIGTGMEMCA